MTRQPIGRDAAGRWVKRYKKRRFQSAVAPCRTDRDAERAAWGAFLAFRATVDEEVAAADAAPFDMYRLAILFQEAIADWCATELRLFEQSGEVPLLEHIGPDGELRGPEDWRTYLEGRRRKAVAAAGKLRRDTGRGRPPALPANAAFPFLADLSVELPENWAEQVAADCDPTPPPRRTDAAALDAQWLEDYRERSLHVCRTGPNGAASGRGRRRSSRSTPPRVSSGGSTARKF